MAEQQRDREREGRVEHNRGTEDPSAPWPGRKTLAMQLSPVQLRADGAGSAGDLHALAAQGLSGSASLLPHLPAIQAAFGRHDVSSVSAHIGGPAADAAHALGAEAYASGNAIAFREQPSLFTTAHEAAHVVQQRGGVQLAGGVGAAGDRYEQHADAVAERVVRGESAESLLDQMAGGSHHGAVQARATADRNPLGHALARRLVANEPALQLQAIQLTTSNGVSISGMQFAPKELPADGASTAQATVAYAARVGGGATIDWSIVGAAAGSTVDVTGKITAGAALPAGVDKQQLQVKAVDHKEAGAHTSAKLTLWDPKVLQAKKDLPKFLAGAYSKANQVPSTGYGKFDVSYAPNAHRLTVNTRLLFNYVNDGKTNWTVADKKKFAATTISKIQNAWTGQWQFENIREPKSIWKALNPVSVVVRVKEDAAAPHYTVTVHKKDVRPFVAVATPTADFGGNLNTKQKNPFPLTGAAELAQLTTHIPTPVLFAAPNAVIGAGDQTSLAFLGRYLHSVRNPTFALSIAGHAKQDPAAVTPADKAKAAKTARTLSGQRAGAVKSAIAAAGVTQHALTTSAKGDVGMGPTAADDRVEITASIRPGYQNSYTFSEHEYGHMLGIDDEYPGSHAVGANTDHYNLVKTSLGQDYADAFAKVTVDSEGLMQGGHDVRPQHYVTMWEALAAVTAAAAVPVPPFGQADWKFRGV
jgi:hypothetical protein